ncbi:hypothetical protein CVT26_004405 [Gymnopilus dilepis]|uniref:Uncharacterized protein n=1 Tax=Gymnopilus dilepis TaxID=231916 RepID=A0A409WY51_9AGAR|nr:hypothetical protein CVT26_004405 [Gymnopilus dilepis]
MKFSLCLSLLPLLASCVSTVMAYPVHRTNTVDLATRADFEDALVNYLQRRDLEDAIIGYLERRGHSSSRQTEEDKERRRQEKERERAEKERHREFREQYKAYKDVGREIHKEAKAEGRTNVNTAYISGSRQHEDKSINVAEKEWRNNYNLQQFTHADITTKVLPNGRKHASVRFHKDDGKPGVYTNHYWD